MARNEPFLIGPGQPIEPLAVVLFELMNSVRRPEGVTPVEALAQMSPEQAKGAMKTAQFVSTMLHQLVEQLTADNEQPSNYVGTA